MFDNRPGLWGARVRRLFFLQPSLDCVPILNMFSHPDVFAVSSQSLIEAEIKMTTCLLRHSSPSDAHRFQLACSSVTGLFFCGVPYVSLVSDSG